MTTATIHPAEPTVGDPIAIDFPAPVALDPSPRYEIVSQHGAHAVVRTFEAKPFAVSGRMGNVTFKNLVVPVRSVLKAKDAMTPAPLIAPRREAFPMSVMIAIAVVVALIAMVVATLLRRRKKPAVVVAEVPPAERFRAAVLALRDDDVMRWSKFATDIALSGDIPTLS